MRILVLGGTVFLGRAFVEAALARGHDLTLFNRGRTNPGLFPEVETVHGDRKHDLGALEGRRFDAVLDLSGYVPADVTASAEALRHCGHYVFVSSVSAYADLGSPPNEESAVAELGDASADELAADFSNYGALKALCERAVWDRFREHSLLVRPGLIVGPHDPTGRFTYWAQRLARGGTILAPGPPERRVQFVDVRDLAAWLLHGIERRLTGVFNATHPGLPWADLLAGADVTWVDDAFLQEHGVGEWMELPLWIASPAFAGMHAADVSRAVGAGLRFRPLAETLAGAAAAPAVGGVGLTPEREAELRSAWRSG